MSKLKISLALYNGSGAIALAEDEDEKDITVHVASWDKDPAACCKAAAEKLRDAADRFEKLATMKKPFHEETHNKINA